MCAGKQYQNEKAFSCGLGGTCAHALTSSIMAPTYQPPLLAMETLSDEASRSDIVDRAQRDEG